MWVGGQHGQDWGNSAPCLGRQGGSEASPEAGLDVEREGGPVGHSRNQESRSR